MKKRTIIPALTLTLALACAGCASKQPAPTTVPTTPPTTEAVVETTEATTATTVTLPEESEAPTVTPTEANTPTEAAAPSDAAPAATAHTHAYKSKVTKAPTCTASGVKTYTCECGASYTENIKPLDHAFVITTSEPTCTSSGCTTYNCKECGYTYTENIREALGHAYGPMVTVRNPTELEAGLAERTCTRCGAKDTVVLPKLNPQP